MKQKLWLSTMISGHILTSFDNEYKLPYNVHRSLLYRIYLYNS